ncbi:hypothetical protein [Streptomyces guryensis]|uniref:Uncharacterized protein n=1 Tax=Streptomyces guryensis TaxID=2886947 RepID=A0A9Q3VMN9_9ACTN|nr:hypothetical protein [Streptomyces guryensis]MCD9874369.1 hypothetical protein [Streptomyces guryensis]
MARVRALVDEGGGVVLVGDASLSVVPDVRSVRSGAVAPRALAGREVNRRRGEVRPGDVLVRGPIRIEGLDLADRVRLELLGKSGASSRPAPPPACMMRGPAGPSARTAAVAVATASV